MSKFKLVVPLIAAAALICTMAVQAAAPHDSSAGGAQLAMASVAAVGVVKGAPQAAASTSSEPSNYALMAAGLGVIGFVASRRRKQF
jgi:hypothetical protein